MNNPDKLRLQYKIAVLRHKQNLTELALHEILSSGEGEEVSGSTGSDRGLVVDDSLACMTSYLSNYVMKTSQQAFKNFMRMFDELLIRVGTRISK